MTVSAGVRKVSYTGTGANTVLSTVFPFFDADDLEVQQRITSTGAVTILTLGVHYTVAVAVALPGVGSVTPVDGATDFTSSMTWTIVRTTDRSQGVDYVENDSFPSGTHERALDRLTLIAQETDDDSVRSLRFPASDGTSLDATLPTSVERASMSLGFDADGNPVALAGTVSGDVTVTPFAETILDDEDAATVHATLGLEIGTDVQAWDADLDTLSGLAKTDNNVIKGTGATWESAAVAASEVTVASAATPLTGSDVEAVLDAAGALFVAGFSKSFTSSPQTITAAGQLVIAHGLSARPKLVVAYLTCTDAGGDVGYTQNQTVEVGCGSGQSSQANSGQSIILDATNITVRFGSNANSYQVLNAGTGGNGLITNSKWTITFVAFA
jgi:hypothetical protein